VGGRKKESLSLPPNYSRENKEKGGKWLFFWQLPGRARKREKPFPKPRKRGEREKNA